MTDYSELKRLADGDGQACMTKAELRALISEVERGQRMLLAACVSLGNIGEALGADMDDDADHLIGMISDLKAENETLRTVATELRGWAECEHVHHCKSEQHEHDEPCKVLARIDAAMSKGASHG